MLTYVTTLVPMLDSAARRPPFPASTCLNISHTHTPARPFHSLANSLSPPYISQPSLSPYSLSFLNACHVYRVSKTWLHCLLMPWLPPQHTARTWRKRLRRLCRAGRSEEHPLGDRLRQHALPSTPVPRTQRCSIPKRLPRTKFGVSWLQADRLTDSLSTLAWQLGNLHVCEWAT